MTTHLKGGKRRDRMVTFLVTQQFFNKMLSIVENEKDDEIRNISDLVRIATKKEIKRRLGEWTNKGD